MSVVCIDSPASFRPSARRPRPRAGTGSLRIAILGFGTVGRSVARLIAHAPSNGVTLTRIANRDVPRKRVDWLPATVEWSESLAETVRSPDVDLVIELLGGIEPAATCIRDALDAGKSVVTANKQVMARYGSGLFDLAARRRVELRCEAAAGGAVPIVRALSESLRADRITSVLSVLNGTSNYVLERRARGVSLAEAISAAQAAGFAEADPAADIDGRDAAAKLALLSLFAFGVPLDPDRVPRRSIAAVHTADFALAQRVQLALKPVAFLSREGASVSASVGPALVARSSPLAAVTGARNAMLVRGEHSGETVLAGEGAGGEPTAVAVVSDVMSVAGRARWRPPCVGGTDVSIAEPDVRHVVRLDLFERGGLPAVVNALHAQNACVRDVITLAGNERAAPVALGLDRCKTSDVWRAIAAVEAAVPFRAPASVLPVFEGGPDGDHR